jgi:hypothetical protein
MSFEYKTVGAPERGKRKRGLRTVSDRVAAAFDDILQAEAVDGWEYLRTDLLPVTDRTGWFGRSREMHRAVMVFRRPLKQVQATEGDVALRPAAPVTLGAVPAAKPEPEVGMDPDLRLAEAVRGPSEPKSGR